MPARDRVPASMTLAACALAALAVAGLVPSTVHGATVSGLYEATVPLGDRSEKGQSAALQDALRQVLVKVTGVRDAGNDPALAPLIADARRYVQQFRVVDANEFFAGFDGAKLERVLLDAGQPLWGHERPATLVCLVVDDGSGRRRLIDSGSDVDARQVLDRTASARGVPLVWPGGAGAINANTVWNAPAEQLRANLADYGADAALVGRIRGSGASNSLVDWTLLYGSETSAWRGSLEEGVNGAADKFAGAFAAGSGAAQGEYRIVVSGVTDLAAYARVTDYLESLTLVRVLNVDELSADTVVYSARVRGDSERLARAIELNGRLRPVAGSAAAEAGTALSYRYQP